MRFLDNTVYHLPTVLPAGYSASQEANRTPAVCPHSLTWPRSLFSSPSLLLTETSLRSSLLGISILSIYFLFKQLLNDLTNLEQKSGNWAYSPGVVVRIHPPTPPQPPTKTSPLETAQKKSCCSCFPWISVVLHLMQSALHKACWF